MITNKNEAKTMAKHISFHCKYKFNSTSCNLKEKWNNKTCQCKCKNYHQCKKDYSWNPSTCIFENSKYLKGNVDTSAIACEEIIYVMDIVSTKMRKTIARNMPINFHSKKVRHKIDCNILYQVLLVLLLLLVLHIAVDNYYYLLSLTTK